MVAVVVKCLGRFFCNMLPELPCQWQFKSKRHLTATQARRTLPSCGVPVWPGRAKPDAVHRIDWWEHFSGKTFLTRFFEISCFHSSRYVTVEVAKLRWKEPVSIGRSGFATFSNCKGLVCLTQDLSSGSKFVLKPGAAQQTCGEPIRLTSWFKVFLG